EVLNAKFHEREAEIIIQAGRPGAVTIATNMAGRGTDIVLGGNVEAEIRDLKDPSDAQIAEMREAWQTRHDNVLAAGGLHIIGTERHESRRIDNQLRGRAGRQGDAGSSRFYLSLEDNLLRIFAKDRMGNIMQKLWTDEEEALEHPMVTRAIENAQRKVEGHNFDIRKQLLEYDDVANDQRKVIYEQRNDLLELDSVEETIHIVRHDILNEMINMHIPPGSPDEMWDVEGLENALATDFNLELPLSKWLDEDDSLYEETLREKIEESARTAYARQEAKLGADLLRQFEKNLMLQVLDQQWKDHLAAMDYLRQGIHLRGYAQKNPKQEYKREAFEMFSMLLESYKREVCGIITREMFRAEEQIEADLRDLEARQQQQAPMQYQHAEASAMAMASEAEAAEEGDMALAAKPYVREDRKVGRNEPCPCGSGKKYKQCHGKLA
ncbi:MAG: SEC-C metal-binding domain-containing protein, partial [Pseudomonadota bacterium]